MQNPAKEIEGVVTVLVTSPSSVQKAALEKYFTPDSGFSHPICAVKRGPDSRQRILGIYQWYRAMSPDTTISINEVVYDKEKNVLYLEMVQRFHIRFNPFPSSPARLITRLTLQENDGRHHICMQEDFYHPGDLAALVVPPLKSLVDLGLRAATAVSNVNAWVAHMFGIGDSISSRLE